MTGINRNYEKIDNFLKKRNDIVKPYEIVNELKISPNTVHDNCALLAKDGKIKVITSEGGKKRKKILGYRHLKPECLLSEDKVVYPFLRDNTQAVALLTFKYRARIYMQSRIAQERIDLDQKIVKEEANKFNIEFNDLKISPDATLLDMHVLNQIAIQNMKPLQELDYVHEILDIVITECLGLESDLWMPFDSKQPVETREVLDSASDLAKLDEIIAQKHRESRHARIVVFLQNRFPRLRYSFYPGSPALAKILQYIDDFVKIWDSRKPLDEKEATAKGKHLLDRRNGVIKHIIHDLKHHIDFNITTATGIEIPPDKKLQVMQHAFDIVIHEILLDRANNIAIKAKDPTELSFSLMIKCKPSPELVSFLNKKIDSKTNPTNFELLQGYVGKALNIKRYDENSIPYFHPETDDKRSEPWSDFLKEYNEHIRDLEAFKKEIIEDNANISDMYLDDEHSDEKTWSTLIEYDIIEHFNEVISMLPPTGTNPVSGINLDALASSEKQELKNFVEALKKQATDHAKEKKMNQGKPNPKGKYTR